MRELFKKITALLVICAFSIVQIFPIGLSVASAQLIPSGMVGGVLNLPVPGTMVSVSPHFAPPIIRGLTVYPENPLRFGFIIDSGDDNLQGDLFEVESEKLIKYFLAALTTPEDEFWVNLSPYEKDRIIPDGLGVTELGRDMLAQDYLLKQLTASLMYPEDELGEEFWNRIYAKAQKIYGTTEIPVNTFNKVWIVPDKAVVYEHEGKVFVGERHLKVMLEEDYLAMENNQRMDRRGLIHQTQDKNTPNNFQSEIIREVLIPEIEKEVNEGELFANLRQIYNSMILATWYKQNLRESLLGQVYMDQNKVKGIDLEDKQIKQKIYDQYLEAFKIGVYDYIKEDYDSATKEIIPRKYFSGGLGAGAARVKDLETRQLVSSPVAKQSEIVGPESTYGNLREAIVDLYDVGSEENITITQGLKKTAGSPVNETNGKRFLVSSVEQKLQNIPQLLEEVIDLENLEKLSNVRSFWPTASIWTEMLEGRFQKLSKVSKLVGEWIPMHNTRKNNVDRILNEGIEPNNRNQIGIGSYDFQDRNAIEFFLAGSVWDVMGRGSTGRVGWVELQDIVAMIVDPNDKGITNYFGKNIREQFGLRNGEIWDNMYYDKNLPVLFSIDLSIPEIELNNVIDQFVDQHQNVFQLNKIDPDRLKQIAVVYIWMGRFIRGIEKYYGKQRQAEDNIDGSPTQAGSPIEIIPQKDEGHEVGQTDSSSPVTLKSTVLSLAFLISLGVTVEAGAADVSLDQFDRAYMVDQISLGIISAGDKRTGIAVSHLGFPGFETVKFTYDAAVDPLVLKASGKQQEAERRLDRYAKALRFVKEKSNRVGIRGIVKTFERRHGPGNVRGLINAFNITSTQPQGQGQLEYIVTPGPNAFMAAAFLGVNTQKYLDVALMLGDALLSMQRPDGGVSAGDRGFENVDIEPHMDTLAVFLQLYEVTGDPKWKKASDNAWKYFVNSGVYRPEENTIWQGVHNGRVNRVFATDTYSWTMAGPAGDRMSLKELKGFTETMLNKSLTRVTLELPNGKIKTVVLVDFADPENSRVMGERKGFHPMGSVEWTGGVILALQKNAVRLWKSNNSEDKKTAQMYKALAEYLIVHSLNTFYELPGLDGLLSFYATGQNVATGHGWNTPTFYFKKRGAIVRGGSFISAWTALPIKGVNPLILGDTYKKFYDQISLNTEVEQKALHFIDQAVKNRSFQEQFVTDGKEGKATKKSRPQEFPIEQQGSQKDLWSQGEIGQYASYQWNSKAIWADFSPEVSFQKGQKLNITYSLQGGNVWGVQLIPKGVPESDRGDMIVKRNVRGNNKTIEITVPSSRDVWRIGFQYGKNAWGHLGGSMEAELTIHSIEVLSSNSGSSPVGGSDSDFFRDSPQAGSPVQNEMDLIDASTKERIRKNITNIINEYNKVPMVRRLNAGMFAFSEHTILEFLNNYEENLLGGVQNLIFQFEKIKREKDIAVEISEATTTALKRLNLQVKYLEKKNKDQVSKKFDQFKNSPTQAGSPIKSFEAREEVGGIDFNPELLDLQIKRDGKGIPLPVSQQPIEQMNIQGFFPVIINISPITVPMILGWDVDDTEAPLHQATLDPADKKRLEVERESS